MGIPTVDAPRTSADPQQAGAVLVQGHDEGIAERSGIAFLVNVAADAVVCAAQVVEAIRRADPEMAGVVIEHGVDLVAADGIRVVGGMAQIGEHLALSGQVKETRAERAYPERVIAAIRDIHHLLAGKRRLGALQIGAMDEMVAVITPSIDTGGGADPHIPVTILDQVVDLIVDQRFLVRVAVPQVVDPAGLRVEDIDPRIQRSQPHQPATVDQQGPHEVARDRACVGLVMLEDGKGITGAIPACDTRTFDGNPQVRVFVLDDREDEVARQAILDARRIGIAVYFAAVVPDESILGAEPHEALRVLQGRVDGPLWQAFERRQMLENQRTGVCGHRRGGTRADDRDAGEGSHRLTNPRNHRSILSGRTIDYAAA